MRRHQLTGQDLAKVQAVRAAEYRSPGYAKLMHAEKEIVECILRPMHPSSEKSLNDALAGSGKATVDASDFVLMLSVIRKLAT